MNHEAAYRAMSTLGRVEFVDRILLQSPGGKYRDRKVYVGIVTHDDARAFPLEDDGTPMGLQSRVKESLAPIEAKYSVSFNVEYLWESDLAGTFGIPAKRPMKEIGNVADGISIPAFLR